jgi:hypothetical protein
VLSSPPVASRLQGIRNFDGFGRINGGDGRADASFYERLFPERQMIMGPPGTTFSPVARMGRASNSLRLQADDHEISLSPGLFGRGVRAISAPSKFMTRGQLGP